MSGYDDAVAELRAELRAYGIPEQYWDRYSLGPRASLPDVDTTDDDRYQVPQLTDRDRAAMRLPPTRSRPHENRWDPPDPYRP